MLSFGEKPLDSKKSNRKQVFLVGFVCTDGAPQWVAPFVF
jgi:hypothetical protein